jgi:hypothetical protein
VRSVAFGVLLSLLTVGNEALAAEAAAPPVAHGQVDWSARVLTATGNGAPDLKAANAAVARLGAERVAKLDALRNLLESVKGLRVSGTVTGGELEKSAEVKAKVEGTVKNFKVVDTKYFSDGGVELVVQVPLDGVLLETLVSDVGKAAAAVSDPKPGDSTGLVIDAKGLGAVAALAPRLMGDDGKEIYGPDRVTKEAAQSRGVAAYTKTMDDAMRDSRAGANPLVVRAARLAAPQSSDLVVSADDAGKIQKLAGLLAAGRVIIVVD